MQVTPYKLQLEKVLLGLCYFVQTDSCEFAAHGECAWSWWHAFQGISCCDHTQAPCLVEHQECRPCASRNPFTSHCKRSGAPPCARFVQSRTAAVCGCQPAFCGMLDVD